MFNWLTRFFGGYTAYQPGTGRIVPVQQNATSGINVNETTSLTIPSILQGVRLIGQTIGSQHWDLIQHLERGEQIARTHPVHRLLHDEPNELQTSADFRSTLLGHAIIYGNGYAYIERNGNFRPTALVPLLPDRTKPQLEKGKLTYRTFINENEVVLEPYEVFHVKGFAFNATMGLPLVQLMRDTLGLSKAQEEFAAKFFGAGCNVGGVFEFPGALSDTARQNIKASMEREYGGLGNAFRILFMEQGAKFTKMSVDPEAAQFIEGRQFALADIARVLGLPPHLLYDLSRSTNNNIEWQGIEAVNYAFNPWAKKLSDEANRKLLYESEKDEFETRIDLKPLMMGDALSQANRDKIRFDCLGLTPNEIRAKDGLNPIEGGDQLYLNTAYLPLSVAIAKAMQPTAAPGQPNAPAAAGSGQEADLGEASDQGADDSPPADPSKGIKDPDGQPGPAVPAKLMDDDLGRSLLRPVVADAVGRILRREAKAIENARKKCGEDAAAFSRWYDQWETEQRSHIAEVLAPVGKAMEAMGLKLDGYTERHLATSRAALSQSMEEGIRIEEAVKHLLGESK